VRCCGTWRSAACRRRREAQPPPRAAQRRATSTLPAITRTRPRSSLSPPWSGSGSGHPRRKIGRHCPRTAHRAATLASGSDVTGAPARSRGATKL
jgi:hypothetical protein